jgi:co-chaperonin GroES (HSP10)
MGATNFDAVVAPDGFTGPLTADTINEQTANAGVTIDGARIKDGAIQAGQQDDVVAITGDGAITIAPSSIFLSKGSAAAITIAAPTATTHDGIIIRIVAISAQAHVVTCATVGFNAKGSSGTLTFGGAIGDSVVIEAYQGNWYTVGAPRNVTAA